MQHEQLVDIVTRAVMRRLIAGQPTDQPLSTPKVLALFCGGTIGLAEGLAALAAIRSQPAEVAVVLSAAAERVVGAQRVRDSLGADTVVVTAQDPYPGKILRAADVVAVPVLTQNTAAKLAHTFTDTPVTTLVLQALMLGKPVVMAANAANPRDRWRAGMGMDRAPANLARALQDNLQRIAGYGARLVDVSLLAAVIRKCFRPEAPPAAKGPAARTLIDAAAVKAALASGNRRLAVPRGAIVTPLAADAARESAVELVEVDS